MAGGDDRDRVDRLHETVSDRWAHSDDDLDRVESHLESDDAEERARAAWDLAELVADDPDRSRGIPVESKLAPLLDDDDRWVRRGASWAMAAIADRRPDRARPALSKITERLSDDDALVRENSVLALSNVAVEHPRAAEPALSRLAELVTDGEGLTRRYAVEAFRDLLIRLEADGFPQAIATTPDVASVLPSDAGVVEVTDDHSDGQRVRIESEADTDSAAEDGAVRSGVDVDETLGPPEQIPSLPRIEADRRTFERLGDVGEGPVTAVVKARAPTADEGGQFVAVSVRTLRPDVSVDPNRVEAAFRSWAGVDGHDHVASILARGTDPRPWVATGFPDGGRLRSHLGSIGFERGLWYAQCLTTALCHGHAKGVVHGALRPGAVGLSRTLDGWPVPEVGDWGLGDLFAEVRPVPVPPAYAAPEHVAPERFGRPDPATDVYQLGALCYALFAGRPPFVGDASEIARRVEADPPEAPSEFASGVPSEVDDLLDRALTKEKRARFETAEDFRRELDLVVREYGFADW